MENTYYNGNGKFQADFNRLCDDLIPTMGNCDTVAGEMLRSVTRLAHDLYNNGMGNNTSGAVNFLLAKGAIDDRTHSTIHEFTRGLLYEGHYKGDSFQCAVESAIDQTVQLILNNPELITQPNTEDMFDYEEDFQKFCDDCGDEVEYYGVCSYCEESYYDEEEEYEY